MKVKIIKRIYNLLEEFFEKTIKYKHNKLES